MKRRRKGEKKIRRENCRLLKVFILIAGCNKLLDYQLNEPSSFG